MQRGGKFQSAIAMLALAACNAQEGKLAIRSIPAPVSSIAKPVPERVAEARGQLALGNVALALESYRKALREQPDNLDALVGMANCYDRMGRFDLSRRNYESALALAPRDTALLGAFASSLDMQGLTDDAAGVRNEIKAVMTASFHPPMEKVPLKFAQVIAPVTPAAPVPVVAASSVKIALPAPEPAALAAAAASPVAIAEAAVPALPTAPALQVPQQPAPVVAQPAKAPVAPPPVAAPTAPTAEAEQAPPSAVAPPTAPQVKAPAGNFQRPFFRAPVRSAAAEPSLPISSGPRLERLSLGEVALLTSARPQWRATTVQRSQRSTTIRFVPLREASVRTASLRLGNVRLLNAARYQGIAANTRSILAQRGWKQMEIGNAAKVRQTSLILYPPSRRATAKRLATQFGFAMASRPEGSELVMLIGRDASRLKPRSLA